VELTFHGANFVQCAIKGAKLGIDPIVPGIDFKSDKLDIIVSTINRNGQVVLKNEQLHINTPGEYEARGFSIKGIAARAHLDEAGTHNATMYRIDTNGIMTGVVGHVHPDLSDDELEALGMLDVLVVPVGGNGYTLDAEGAAKVVRAIEPKVVIPTHYADEEVKYEVPQNELQGFIEELGAPTQEETKYKVKGIGDFPEQLTVVVLNRTS
jgi:L-ascorbate metabolism protein UlaG (beta-lactamase superfamily)